MHAVWFNVDFKPLLAITRSESLSRSAGMIGHHHMSRLGVSPGCKWEQQR
ncbi:hypothetical protein RISK_001297 [Rhodopirellula islandica]|uniref:Uncharacterized protein n=1 Tax=Rhodopirellula islandica TaxID=595434 RepID=A0A0J1BJZ4_RHOIS|nr:hypothetical protein RISK_001297 [Rhodopirellula islandica]